MHLSFCNSALKTNNGLRLDRNDPTNGKKVNWTPIEEDYTNNFIKGSKLAKITPSMTQNDLAIHNKGDELERWRGFPIHERMWKLEKIKQTEWLGWEQD